MTEDVFGVKRLVMERNRGDEVNQLAKFACIYLQARVVLVQNILQFGVFLFNLIQRIIEEATKAHELVSRTFAVLYLDICSRSDLSVGFEEIPTRQRRHP